MFAVRRSGVITFWEKYGGSAVDGLPDLACALPARSEQVRQRQRRAQVGLPTGAARPEAVLPQDPPLVGGHPAHDRRIEQAVRAHDHVDVAGGAGLALDRGQVAGLDAVRREQAAAGRSVTSIWVAGDRTRERPGRGATLSTRPGRACAVAPRRPRDPHGKRGQAGNGIAAPRTTEPPRAGSRQRECEGRPRRSAERARSLRRRAGAGAAGACRPSGAPRDAPSPSARCERPIGASRRRSARSDAPARLARRSPPRRR